jgi:hypothetical protein
MVVSAVEPTTAGVNEFWSEDCVVCAGRLVGAGCE